MTTSHSPGTALIALYPDLDGDALEQLHELRSDIAGVVHYLNGVLADIDAGKFTPKEAARSAEEIQNIGGWDVTTLMECYGEATRKRFEQGEVLTVKLHDDGRLVPEYRGALQCTFESFSAETDEQCYVRVEFPATETTPAFSKSCFVDVEQVERIPVTPPAQRTPISLPHRPGCTTMFVHCDTGDWGSADHLIFVDSTGWYSDETEVDVIRDMGDEDLWEFASSDSGLKPSEWVAQQEAQSSEVLPKVTVSTGCFECDAEDEFTGFVDTTGVAHFPCPHCNRTFTIADWDTFFDAEEVQS